MVKKVCNVHPFRLVGSTPRPTHSRSEKVIYTKNQYSEGVKYRNWQDLVENKPIDVDPYCHGKVNHFLSHYHRFGTDKQEYFTTTTDEMLNQVFIKDKMMPEKIMKNYYSYNDNAECLNKYKQQKCPLVCANDFSTTMKHSFQVPHPYVMQRLAFPKIPFMQNRRYKQVHPNHRSTKFHDDSYVYDTCQLIKHKSLRSTSYNPMTGTYTNWERKAE